MATIETHLKHLERVIGKAVPIAQIKLGVLQRYVDERSRDYNQRERKISPVTIRKEMTTFCSVWNWASHRGHVESRFPNRGLKYPKTEDKPPFQSWEQIERRISRGWMSEYLIRELWDALYLSSEQVSAALDHVENNAKHAFIYPIILTAAHTGMRRSELMRAEIDDFDLCMKTVHVREKKRVRGRITTRVVPLSELLCHTLRDWFEKHPGGQVAFCLGPDVSRSRKVGPRPITADEANHHFKHVFQNSKWSVLRGWHVFRHSFASNCALKGLDQRMINEWMGHQTEAMVRRYWHLFPDQQQGAVNSVFV